MIADFINRLQKDLNLPSKLCPVLEKLWLAGEDGSLCIELDNKEIESFSKPFPGLVLEENYLYFEKNFTAKQKFENHIKAFLERNHRIPNDPNTYKEAIEIVQNRFNADWRLNEGQIQAILNSTQSAFQIITGGPGTGKTTVVAILLEVLNQLGELPDLSLVALTAPTGRAAQRLTESIQESLHKIDSSLIHTDKLSNQLKGRTIHNLLEYKPYLQDFYYNKNRYLPQQIILVDEVSMVDINLMNSLLDALPPDSIPIRFILLGDPHQLPSVEKGAILSDFISAIESRSKQESHSKNISYLTKTNRQILKTGKSISDINQLADKILNFDAQSENSKQVLTEINLEIPTIQSLESVVQDMDTLSDVVWFLADDKKPIDQEIILSSIWNTFYLPQIIEISQWKLNMEELRSQGSFQKFSQFIKTFRCLTTNRVGYYGVEGIHSAFSKIAIQSLNKKNTTIQKKILSSHIYYEGLPLMITKNDKSRKLFNGDIGYVLYLQDELRAVFPIDNQLHSFALDTLPEHEDAYFLTIHKSQGSEYETVLLYLPHHKKLKDSAKRGLNKQLLYTAITRAKKQVILTGDPNEFTTGIETSMKRLTGVSVYS